MHNFLFRFKSVYLLKWKNKTVNYIDTLILFKMGRNVKFANALKFYCSVKLEDSPLNDSALRSVNYVQSLS